MISKPPVLATRGCTYTGFVNFNKHDFEYEVWKVPVTSVYKGKIIFAHGLGENLLLYGKYFETILNQGYEVFFYTQRLTLDDPTSTLTSVVQIPRDYMAGSEEYNNLDIADLDSIIKYNLDERHDKTEKFYLMGNGLGSALIICYAMMGKYQDWVKLLIALLPTVEIHPKSQPHPLVRQVTPFLTRITPNVRVYHKVNFSYMTLDPGWLKYLQDVVYKEKIRVLVKEYNQIMIRSMSLTLELFVKRFNPNISIFVAHADCDYINSLDGTRSLFNMLGNNIDKEMIVIKNAKHMLINERRDVVDRVTLSLLTFMNKYANEKYGSVYNSL